jgi:hypothetical protein
MISFTEAGTKTSVATASDFVHPQAIFLDISSVNIKALISLHC